MAAKKKSKVKKVKEMAQTHGMEESTEPTTLDQVWGDTGVSRYKTMDVNEYESQLNDMNKSDLQAHAQKIGLLPIDNVTQLRGRLLREFNKHVSAYKRPRTHPHSWSTKNLSTEARQILSEGM